MTTILPLELFLHSAGLVKHLLHILDIARICKCLNNRRLDIELVFEEGKVARGLGGFAAEGAWAIYAPPESLEPPYTDKTASNRFGDRESFLLLKCSELPFFLSIAQFEFTG